MSFSSMKRFAIAIGVASTVSLAGSITPNAAHAFSLDSSWKQLGNTSISGGTANLTAGAFNVAKVESFLGLSSGTLSTLNGAPTGGSAIKKTFFAQTGAVVSFDWLFQAGDYLPYNDFSFVSLVPTPGASLLSDVATVGNNGNSGLQSFSYVIPTAGKYTLGLGVFNSLDNAVSSTLQVSNVATTGVSVPTPALLPGVVGMGVAAFRKRKKEKAIG